MCCPLTLDLVFEWHDLLASSTLPCNAMLRRGGVLIHQLAPELMPFEECPLHRRMLPLARPLSRLGAVSRISWDGNSNRLTTPITHITPLPLTTNARSSPSHGRLPSLCGGAELGARDCSLRHPVAR